MKYYSHASYNCAAHEDGSRVAHKIELYMKVNSCVTCEFGPSNLTKIQEHTRVVARECQLRCEQYHTYVAKYVCMYCLLTITYH